MINSFVASYSVIERRGIDDGPRVHVEATAELQVGSLRWLDRRIVGRLVLEFAGEFFNQAQLIGPRQAPDRVENIANAVHALE